MQFRSVGFFRSQLIWIYTVCKDRAYLGSSGSGLIFSFLSIYFSFGILPLETPSPNEAKQSIPFITPSPMALSETNVDSKAPRKVCIFFTAGGQYSRCGQTMQLWNSHNVSITKTHSNMLKNLSPKQENFQKKKSDIFHIPARNINCGYSLERPQRDCSNEYPQSMFFSKIRKNNVYLCKPQFYYIKVGFKGVKII